MARASRGVRPRARRRRGLVLVEEFWGVCVSRQHTDGAATTVCRCNRDHALTPIRRDHVRRMVPLTRSHARPPHRSARGHPRARDSPGADVHTRLGPKGARIVRRRTDSAESRPRRCAARPGIHCLSSAWRSELEWERGPEDIPLRRRHREVLGGRPGRVVHLA
jgi:hypothetical protein